jgi:hypothetical protein
MADKLEPPVDASASSSAGERTNQRKIPGNLPYLPSPPSLTRVLDKIIDSQRPERFTTDFLENVLKQSGGSARATIPILKRLGFLDAASTPTELYAKFETDSGRAQAALSALRNGFPEIFRRNEYAHQADDNRLKDLSPSMRRLPNDWRLLIDIVAVTRT